MQDKETETEISKVGKGNHGYYVTPKIILHGFNLSGHSRTGRKIQRILKEAVPEVAIKIIDTPLISRGEVIEDTEQNIDKKYPHTRLPRGKYNTNG